MGQGLFMRHGDKPLITPDHLPFEANSEREIAGRPIYRLGLALLDLENPRKVLARAFRWAFAPQADYEQRGLVPNVVYTCGALLRGDEVWMYYGAADTVIGLAIGKVAGLLNVVRRHDYLHQVGRQKGMVP